MALEPWKASSDRATRTTTVKKKGPYRPYHPTKEDMRHWKRNLEEMWRACPPRAVADCKVCRYCIGMLTKQKQLMNFDNRFTLYLKREKRRVRRQQIYFFVKFLLMI